MSVKDNKNDHFCVTKPVDPEFIMWQNIGYCKSQRKCRKILSGFIALFVILTSQTSLIALNHKKQQYKKSQNLNDCSLEITKMMAYEDNQLEKDEQQGFMNCFCYNQLRKDQTQLIDFKEFNDDRDHCQQFKDNLGMLQRNVYLFTFIISTVNFFGQQLLIYASKNEKMMNASQESTRMFQLIFIQQFISIGIGYEVANFLQEEHYHINNDWVSSVGAQICATLMSSIMSNKGYDISIILYFWYNRCKDRKWTRTLITDKIDIPNS